MEWMSIIICLPERMCPAPSRCRAHAPCSRFNHPAKKLDFRWEFSPVGKVFLNKFHIFVGCAKIRADEIKTALYTGTASKPFLEIGKRPLFGRRNQPSFNWICVNVPAKLKEVGGLNQKDTTIAALK